MSFGKALSYWRHARGLTQAELAQAVGVSRQTLIAVEQDHRLPQLELAVNLARVLEVSLDQLTASLGSSAVSIPHEWAFLPEEPRYSGPVVWSRVGTQGVAVPWALVSSPGRLPDAWWDAERRQMVPLPQHRPPERVILLGGCDPFTGWLEELYQRAWPGYWLQGVALSSTKAVEAFRHGLIHVAGTHWRDPATGEYNRLSDQLGGAVRRYHYVRWQEGWVGNREAPKTGLWAVREPGSEAHALFLRQQGQAPVRETRTFTTHTVLVRFLKDNPRWAGVTIGALAALDGLAFSPWAEEPYDLWIRRSDEDRRWAQQLWAVLESSDLAEALAKIPFLALTGRWA